MGTEWHQEAIGALADMLRDVAVRRAAPWGVCESIALIGLQHQNGADYDPRPDVMVLERPLPRGDLAAIHLADAGAPLFVAEVASNSTKGNDLDDKRLAYAAIGVREYLVFDPTGSVLSTPLLAWRLAGIVYEPWQPDGEGWWYSTALDVSFRATQPFLGVRDRDGAIIAPAGQVRRQAREEARARAELEQRLMAEAQQRAALEQRLMAEARVRAELEQRLDAEALVRAKLTQRLDAKAQRIARLEEGLRQLQAGAMRAGDELTSDH